MKILPLCLLLAGCTIAPLKPGTGLISSPGGIVSSLKQSENPKNESRQEVERRTESVAPDGTKSTTTERAASVIGAAQKDTGRELAAKLSSLKGVVWVGVLVFLFGMASAFYPPLKLIVGSVTTSAACAAAGLALIFLPSIIVGHELLIMGVSLGIAALWFLAHRHGKLSGTVQAQVSTIEALVKKVL